MSFYSFPNSRSLSQKRTVCFLLLFVCFQINQCNANSVNEGPRKVETVVVDWKDMGFHWEVQTENRMLKSLLNYSMRRLNKGYTGKFRYSVQFFGIAE